MILELKDGRNELYQYDTGRILTVGADCTQVHFGRNLYGRSVDVDVVNGECKIPDVLLQSDKDLIAWAFVGTAENGYTKNSVAFKVNRRNKPADYVFTPLEQTTLDKIMQELEEIKAAQDPDAIYNAVNEYLMANPIQESDPTVSNWAKQPEKPKYTADEVGAISADKLGEAVNKALATAKESGEFDGEDGRDGQDGTSVTIAKVTESEADGGENVVEFSDGKTLTVKNGKSGRDGNDGTTPHIGANGNWYLGETDTGIKAEGIDGKDGSDGKDGDDYILTDDDISNIAERAAQKVDIAGVVRVTEQTLTDEQKAQARENIGAIDKTKLSLGVHTDGLVYIFVDSVPVGNGIELSASGDIIGYVDSENNIVVKGALADGTYTVKYEMEDGSTVEIGELVLDNNLYYSVTNNLTNCTSDNSAIQTVEGEGYAATISANDGYELSSVVVTMGGTDITSSAVSGGTISIAEVTGDIVITATAEETAVEITNWIEEVGYTTDIRLSISAGGETTSGAEGCETTGYIPTKVGDILRLKNITTGSNNKNILLYFNSSKVMLDSDYTANVFAIDEGNGVYASNALRNVAGMAYIRFASENIDDTSIVTVNEEIV